jgi:hypothetical protein
MKKRILATILAVLFMLPICALALDYPKPELDHQAAVKRIENAKIYWIQKREPSNEDTPQATVIIDTLDLKNTGSGLLSQRLVIINN